MNNNKKQNLITAGVLFFILGIVLFLFLSSPRPQIEPQEKIPTKKQEANVEVPTTKNLINTDRKLTLFDSEFGSPLDLEKYKNLVGSEIEQKTLLMDISKSPIVYKAEGSEETLTLDPIAILFYYQNDGVDIVGLNGNGSIDLVVKEKGNWKHAFSTQQAFSCEKLDSLGMDRESTIVLNCLDYKSQQYRK